jgi:hypothetical protein
MCPRDIAPTAPSHSQYEKYMHADICADVWISFLLGEGEYYFSNDETAKPILAYTDL